MIMHLRNLARFKQAARFSAAVLPLVLCLNGCRTTPRPDSGPSAFRYTPDADGFVLAAILDDTSALQTYISAGTSPDIRNDSGSTALMGAAAWGRCESVDYLLGVGAEANARNRYGQSSLMLAAKTGEREVLEKLLAHGASVNAVDERGRTALMWAVSKNADHRTIELLLEHGADPRQKDRMGRSAQAKAEEHGRSDLAGVLQSTSALADLAASDTH